MPRPALEHVVEVTTTLSPEERALLLMELQVYEAAVEELEHSTVAIAAMKARLDALRDDLGDGAKKLVPAEGYGLTLVEGVSNSLDKKQLMRTFKITPKQWAAHMRSKPKKAYLLVTTPKATAREVAKAAARAAAPRDERDTDEREEED